MRIKLGTLRKILREALIIEAEFTLMPWPGRPYDSKIENPSREQLGKQTAQALDTVGDPDELPAHLREPEVDPYECLGPVPPTAERPYVTQDPYVTDTAPAPLSNKSRSSR